MGSLIDAAIKDDHDVILFCEDSGRDLGDKDYQQITLQKLASFKSKASKIISVRSVEGVLETDSLDVLVTQEGFHSLKKDLDGVTAVREKGVKVVSLAHFFEIARRPVTALDHFDLTLYTSEFCRDLHFDLQCPPERREKEKQSRSSQYAVTGSPMFDQIGAISRQQARRELGVHDDARVVLLVAPVISPITPWRFYVWGEGGRSKRSLDALRAGKPQFLWEIWTGNRFAEVVQAIGAFCDRASAALWVKSRGKQKDPAYLQAAADRYVDGFDDSYYPVFTTYKLLAAADLCITANSMAATEAAATGIPCINLSVPYIDKASEWSSKKIAYQTKLLGGEAESLMNYPGVITNIDRRYAKAVFLRSELKEFTVLQESHTEYVKKFLGIGELSASERILIKLQKLLKKE